MKKAPKKTAKRKKARGWSLRASFRELEDILITHVSTRVDERIKTLEDMLAAEYRDMHYNFSHQKWQSTLRELNLKILDVTAERDKEREKVKKLQNILYLVSQDGQKKESKESEAKSAEQSTGGIPPVTGPSEGEEKLCEDASDNCSFTSRH